MASHAAAAAAPAGLSFASAGLSAEPGAPASANAVKALKEAGIPFKTHAATRLTAELASGADLILAMTSAQTAAVKALCPEAAGRVHALKEYAGGGGDVEDPYGGGESAYRASLAEIRAAVGAALERFKKEVK